MSAQAPEAGSPFLTVVVPVGAVGTQALRETLLSLVGQDDADFEVVLVAAPGTDRTGLEEVVADQPPLLASRLRLVESAGATPGAVRNAGLDVARGDYVTVLPEGDLALGRWTRTFHEAARSAEGHVLRALGVTQDHTLVEVAGHRAVRAVASPRSDSPAHFSLWEHALEPLSPAASWAWPRSLAGDPGVQYDVRVGDDADRELLVRVAQLVEVADLGVVTSLSRAWDPDVVRPHAVDGPTAEELIDSRPLVVAPGEARRIREAAAEVPEDTGPAEELARVTEELRLTHDHAANLEAIVRSLEGQAEATAARHEKEVARLRRKLATREDGSAGAQGGQAPDGATDAPRGRSWRGRRRGDGPAS